MEIKDAGLWAHFCHTGGFWNVVDALRIAMFTISIIGYARILLDPVGWNLELPLPAGQIYVDFANLSEASEHYVLSCSIAIVLCLLSVMKYIRHSQAYGLLIITLAFAGPEIFRFMVRTSKSHHKMCHCRTSQASSILSVSQSLSVCFRRRLFAPQCLFQVMFSIVNLTFVIMGLIMFGNILEEFSTISRSFQTLVRKSSIAAPPGHRSRGIMLLHRFSHCSCRDACLLSNTLSLMHAHGCTLHNVIASFTDDDDDRRVRLRRDSRGIPGLCGHILLSVPDLGILYTGEYVVRETHFSSPAC